MALLQGPAVSITDLGILPDRREAIVAALQEAGSANDLVISTGGVAVGEEDHLKAALVAAGGRVESWQMAVKPGKPVLVGSIGGLLLSLLGLWAVRHQPVDYADIVHLDPAMLALTIVLGVVATLLAGLLPAFRAMRIAPAIQLKTQ